jgi:hypothetical protein
MFVLLSLLHLSTTIIKYITNKLVACFSPNSCDDSFSKKQTVNFTATEEMLAALISLWALKNKKTETFKFQVHTFDWSINAEYCCEMSELSTILELMSSISKIRLQ